MSLFGKKGEHDSSDTHDQPRSKPRVKGKYGIDEVTALMRTLPVDKNPDLVVLVLKNTLRSMNVDLEDIVEDAVAKEQAVEQEITQLNESIAKLEEEVGQRRQEVAAKEADLSELIRVRERLAAAATPDDATIPLTGGPQAVSLKSPRPPPPPRGKPAGAMDPEVGPR